MFQHTHCTNIKCVQKQKNRINQINYLVFVSLSKIVHLSSQGTNSQNSCHDIVVDDGFLFRCHSSEQFTDNKVYRNKEMTQINITSETIVRNHVQCTHINK